MLRLLLDENIGILVYDALRSRGYDVKSILKENAGINDERILALAVEEHRILITLDRDFGRLVFRDLRTHGGVLYLRPDKESPERIIELLLSVFAYGEEKLMGKFVVATDTNVRIRP